MRITIFLILLLSVQSLNITAQSSDNSLIRIALVADIQYADQQKSGTRFYRQSLTKTDSMIDVLNNEELSYIVDLGDRIDRDYKSYVAIENILAKSEHQVIFIPGNHDFVVDNKDKKLINSKTGDKRGYHSSSQENWHFVFLNGMKQSMEAYPKNSFPFMKAKKELSRLKEAGAVNAYDWNGGLGKKQTAWLLAEAKFAHDNDLNLMIFCHQPIFPGNAHSLWNYQSLTEELKDFQGELWWISGHDHKGGFGVHHGINMFTMHGMVEGEGSSFGILEIMKDSVRLIGYGDQPDL